uniref:Uncharacterized protein n=1 Tax=Attheya septentrionalis TaxID=420275 RepID=A0A7S2XR15_9STRA|mmetsp:Transcript_28934/g.52956  ORF Transcript_28934/g.52956 Transcript_28934/m.52956 type:complete len:258 (+) Transcript_28934:297-1070(+)
MCMTTFRQVGVVHPDHDGSRETLPTEQQRFLRCQQSQHQLVVLRNKKEETGILWIRLRNHIWMWCLCMAYNFQQIWRQACVSLTHHHHWNVESFQQSLEEAVVVVPTTTGDAAVGNDHLQEWKQPPPPPMSGILRESKYRNPKRNHRKQQFRSFLHVHRPRSKRKLLILCSSSSSLDDVDDNSMSTTETNKNNDTRATNKKRVTFAAGFVTSTMIIINTTQYKPTRNRNKRSDILRSVSNTTIIVSEESLDSHTFQQ